MVRWVYETPHQLSYGTPHQLLYRTPHQLLYGTPHQLLYGTIHQKRSETSNQVISSPLKGLDITWLEVSDSSHVSQFLTTQKKHNPYLAVIFFVIKMPSVYYSPTKWEGYSFGVVRLSILSLCPHFLSVRKHISVPIGPIWFFFGTNDKYHGL